MFLGGRGVGQFTSLRNMRLFYIQKGDHSVQMVHPREWKRLSHCGNVKYDPLVPGFERAHRGGWPDNWELDGIYIYGETHLTLLSNPGASFWLPKSSPERHCPFRGEPRHWWHSSMWSTVCKSWMGAIGFLHSRTFFSHVQTCSHRQSHSILFMINWLDSGGGIVGPHIKNSFKFWEEEEEKNIFTPQEWTATFSSWDIYFRRWTDQEQKGEKGREALLNEFASLRYLISQPLGQPTIQRFTVCM